MTVSTLARQRLAAGRHELRIRPAHRRDRAAQQREALASRSRPAPAAGGSRRSSPGWPANRPSPLRVPQLVQRVVVELERQERADDGSVRRQRLPAPVSACTTFDAGSRRAAGASPVSRADARRP